MNGLEAALIRATISYEWEGGVALAASPGGRQSFGFTRTGKDLYAAREKLQPA